MYFSFLIHVILTKCLFCFDFILYYFMSTIGLRISIENISRSMYATALLNRELFSVFDIDGIHMDLVQQQTSSITVGEVAFRVSIYIIYT